jgi:hypothetical protein
MAIPGIPGPVGPQGNAGERGPTGPIGPAGPGLTAFEEEIDVNGNLTSVVAQTDLVLDDNTLYYRQDNNKNHSLAWGYSTHGVDGPVLNGFSGVGMAVGDANNSSDTLVAEFTSTGLKLPTLATNGSNKLVAEDFLGNLVSEEKPTNVSYSFTNSNTWTINHNLGKWPDIKVYSTGGKEMWAEILNSSYNQAIVYFDSPTTGFAIVSPQ